MKRTAPVVSKRLFTNTRGYVLMLTFVMMTTLSFIVIAFLLIINVHARASASQVAGAQAVWLAEAGLQDVYYRILNTESYRNNPTTVTDTLGQGSYSAAVSVAGSTYTVTSTGTVSGLSRRIRQSVSVTQGLPPAFSYPVFGSTNPDTLELQDNVTISGDLFYDGDVEVQTGTTVTGLVYADTVSGGGSYTEAGGDPDPIPTYPSFDNSTYAAAITIAVTAASHDLTVSGSTVLDLNGSTYYYKKVTIKNSATVNGPGTLVATDKIQITDNATVANGVIFISADKIEIKKEAEMTGDNILYAEDDMKLEDDVHVAGSFLAPNADIEVKDDAVVSGILYGEEIKLKDRANVTGSVVAKEFDGDKIKDDVVVTYNASSLPAQVPTGFTAAVSALNINQDWDEIPPSS